jgi:hypothetical protein
MDIQNLFEFGKWTFLPGALSLVLGYGFLLQGCGKTRATEEEKINVVAEAELMPKRVIPPIDRSGSLKTETATFALG